MGPNARSENDGSTKRTFPSTSRIEPCTTARTAVTLWAREARAGLRAEDVALGLAAPIVGAAQAPATPPAPPVANPQEVSSPDAILTALYDVISGPAGKARDWNRFRSLFVPGARLIPTRVRPDGDGASATVITPDEYATTIGPRLEQNGFFEREIHRTAEQFGTVYWDSERAGNTIPPKYLPR